MRYIFIILLFLFAGCTAPKSYILESKNIPISNKSINYCIGVKTIELPQYLLSKEIPYLQKDNQITYLKDKKWATYLDEHLTNRLVSTLQKSFNTAKVYKYPQNTSTKPDIILQITINKFIADDNSVILDATCTRSGKKGDKNRLFSIKIDQSSKDDTIENMNKAFSKMESKLINYLSQSILD
jgi:uncharacterized lipoprotein YmbA